MRTRPRWAAIAIAIALASSVGIAACGRSTPSQQSATTNTIQAEARNELAQAPTSSPPQGQGAGGGPGAMSSLGPAVGAASAASPAGGPETMVEPRFREVTVPAGTALSVVLETGVSSSGSAVEDRVRGHLAASVRAGGVTALPAGAQLAGVVVDAKGAGKVKGRGRVAFRFTRITAHDETLDVRTSVYTAQARATKGKDAQKIGIGAGAGAIVGGLIGGGKGAAIGAGVGGGAGTAVVLGTKGKEAHVPSGSRVRLTLQAPLIVRVPIAADKQ